MLPTMAGETDDPQLMTRFATGDVAAFETLYARHKGPLYRYFFRQCGNPDTADELFRDVWLLLIKAGEPNELRARFTTYLYQIAHSGLVEHFRKSGRPFTGGTGEPASAALAYLVEEVPEVVDMAFASARWSLVDWEQGRADASPVPEAASSGEQRASRFQTALDALPIEQREAFLLHEEAEMGLADIAIVTGVGAETVKGRLHYAVKRLGSIVDDLAPAAARGRLK